MNICLPTRDENGLQSQLHDTFEDAPFLALLDAETLEVEFLPRQVPGQGSGLGERPVDAVFCHGMSQPTLTSLNSLGIAVFVTAADNLEETLQAILEGQIRRLDRAWTCSGHSLGGECCGNR